EMRSALNAGDVVAANILVDQMPLAFDDLPLAVHEVADRDVALHMVIDAVHSALTESREIQGRFAQRLRGHGARVHGGAAGLGCPLDDADPLAEVRGLRRAFLTGRTRTDDDKIEMLTHLAAGYRLRAAGGRRNAVY